MSKDPNNAEVVQTCTQRLAALQEHVAAKTEVSMNGTRYTRAQLVSIFQASLDTRASLIKSRAQVAVDLAARDKAENDRLGVETGLKSWVLGLYGENSNEAHEFGYGPRKVGQRSAETVADAVKLAKATRKARGTMGKKQKSSANPLVSTENVVDLRVVA